jgi:hypothetical protein
LNGLLSIIKIWDIMIDGTQTMYERGFGQL